MENSGKSSRNIICIRVLLEKFLTKWPSTCGLVSVCHNTLFQNIPCNLTQTQFNVLNCGMYVSCIFVPLTWIMVNETGFDIELDFIETNTLTWSVSMKITCDSLLLFLHGWLLLSACLASAIRKYFVYRSACTEWKWI